MVFAQKTFHKSVIETVGAVRGRLRNGKILILAEKSVRRLPYLMCSPVTARGQCAGRIDILKEFVGGINAVLLDRRAYELIKTLAVTIARNNVALGHRPSSC